MEEQYNQNYDVKYREVYKNKHLSLNSYLNPITSDMKESEIVLAKISYMQWVDDEDYDRDKIVHFSLLNQEIVEFDYRYFVEQNP